MTPVRGHDSAPFHGYLQALLTALAEGGSVDWTEAGARAQTDDDRKTLSELRALVEMTAAIGYSPDTSRSAPEEAAHDDVPALGMLQKTGRFVIERRLGQGGFGVVYEAYDRARRAHVALKSFNRADIGSIYDFKKEFRVLADLSHPNLVSLYELFGNEESWFIAMELVSGVDFITYVRDGAAAETGARAVAEELPRTECDVTRLGDAMTQLCQALAYLHGEGKLHCDVKPSNVLVTKGGQLKLLDFGLATDTLPASIDDTLRIRGTPAYVAPELAAGERPAESSDWYSVGVMLFEALAGQRPFDGTVAAILDAKRQHAAPAPGTFRTGIPDQLEALCCRLLERQPGARPSDAEVLAAISHIWPTTKVAPEPALVRSDSSPFVGRRAQVAVLDAAFEASQLGTAQVVFVHGASGMGKTALVRRFLEVLRKRGPDAIVLEGRCYERESVPYKGLDSLVDRLTLYLRSLPRYEAEALLPRDAAALARLFPMLRRVDAVMAVTHRSADATSAQELRRRGASAFRELLERLVESHPVVMVIDDLQWTDADSAALIDDLLFGDAQSPVLFVGCYRTEEASTNPALRTLLSSAESAARRGRCAMQFAAVDGLSAGEALELAQVLRNQHHAPASTESIVKESGGSPFFINQLIHYSATTVRDGRSPIAIGGDGGTELTLDSVIRGRTARLGDDARRLLQVVALSAGPLELSLAADAAGLGASALRESMRLRAARLTRSSIAGAEEKIEIYHDRIREAVTGEIPAEALTLLHARLASVLEHARADPEALVHHFHGAGQDERAAVYAVMAGDRAMHALAFHRAVLAYRFAVDFGQHDDGGRSVRIRLGDALAASGRGYDAAQAYLSAAGFASAGELVELKRRAAEQLLQSGHVDEGLAEVRDVLLRVGLRLAATPHRALLSLLVLRARLRLRGLRFTRRPDTQLSTDALVRVDTCWSVTTGLAIVDHIRSAEFGARHLLLALQLGEPLRVVRGLAMELAYISIAGAKSRPRCRKLIEIAERIALHVPNPEAAALVTLAKGSAAYMEGHWVTARQLCESAEQTLRERCTGVAWATDTAQFYTLLSLFYLGHLGELSRRLPALLKDARARDALYAETILRTRISYLTSLASDDTAGAERAVREGMERWSQTGFHNQHYYEMVAAAEIALYSGDGASAWAGVARKWPQLAGTLLLRVQPVLVESLHLRARTAVAAASDPATPSGSRASLVSSAERDARRLRRIDARWAVALGELILSGTATLRRDWRAAIAHLETAERAFERENMGLYLAVTRWRRAELIGATGGQRLHALADGWMRAQAIVNASRFSQMLVPGTFTAVPSTAASPPGAVVNQAVETV